MSTNGHCHFVGPRKCALLLCPPPLEHHLPWDRDRFLESLKYWVLATAWTLSWSFLDKIWLAMTFFLHLRDNDPESPSCLCAQGKIRRVSGFLAWFLNHYIKIPLSPFSFLDKMLEAVCHYLFPGAEDSYFNIYWELKCTHLKDARFEKPWFRGQFSIHFIYFFSLFKSAAAASKGTCSTKDISLSQRLRSLLNN